MMLDPIWTLDHWQDSVKQRELKDVNLHNARFSQSQIATFSSEREAWAAALRRAEAKLEEAKDEVKRVMGRCKKLHKRLEGMIKETAGTPA